MIRVVPVESEFDSPAHVLHKVQERIADDEPPALIVHVNSVAPGEILPYYDLISCLLDVNICAVSVKPGCCFGCEIITVIYSALLHGESVEFCFYVR